jgi:hypothetical protein
MSNVNSVLFESYLKIKNSDFNDRKTDEKASIGYFILNIKEKTFLYKKNKESSNINARHTEKDILNFEETVDYDDKGLCDYPFGFQIITKQKTYILFSISRLIYTRWIDSLKLLFKTMKSVNYNKNITPETSPEKGKNNFVNPSFKQQEKSPISTKAKLSTNNNINNYNFNNEKLIGFDEEFLKAINDMDEHDIKKNYPKNLNLGNPNSFEKGLKSSMNNLNSNKNSHQYEEINSNEVFLISSNQSHGLNDLNQGWEKDMKEIKNFAITKNPDKPTFKKSSELITQMSKGNNNNKKTSAFIDPLTISESKPIMNYKKNFSLFDEHSLHIKQSANEAYAVENLHFGIEDNLNKSIDFKNSQNTNNSKNANKKIWTIKKSQENEKSIDVGNSFAMKKIFENNDNTWTFKITVPLKNDK